MAKELLLAKDPVQEEHVQKIPVWRYLIQSALAGFYIVMVFFLMHTAVEWLTLTCLGASAFMVFALPKKELSSARMVLGGYGVSVACGLAALLLTRLLQPVSRPLPLHLIGSALAVVLSMFFMVLFRLRHASGVAAAASIVQSQHPWLLAVMCMLAAAYLCALKKLTRQWLIDLDR